MAVEYKYRPRSANQDFPVTGENQVLGFKELDVAAGHYEVAELQIESKMNTPRGVFRIEINIFYSPVTGSAILYHETIVGEEGGKKVVELSKFIPGKTRVK